MQIRRATAADQAFIAEMARLACALEGRHPVPAVDAPELVEMMPGATDIAPIAVDEHQRSVGATWCYQDVVLSIGAPPPPPLLRDDSGRPLPEIAIAVESSARGAGIGAALIDALAKALEGQADMLTLNVHLLNPAVRLYARTGFRAEVRGRGWYGVAMSRPSARHRTRKIPDARPMYPF